MRGALARTRTAMFAATALVAAAFGPGAHGAPADAAPAKASAPPVPHAPALVAPTTTSAPVRIGVLAYRGSDAALGEWSPVVEQLRRALPQYRFDLVQRDLDGLRASVANGTVSFVITNPGHYVQLEAEFGASRILTLAEARMPSVQRAVGSAVIARSDRAAPATLADLEDRRVAVVSREGFGGYQLVWRELAPLGLDPAHDFAATEVVGFPMDNVFEAVAQGRADAGIVRACVLESLPPERRRLFRVVSARSEPGYPCATSTRLYPDWPLATLRRTPPALAKEVAAALLAMPPTARGVAWNVPADYQAVHELFRELQIGPYADLREPTLSVLAQRYWPAVAFAALVLMGWVFYTVRVEHLVQARTAELRAALAAREAMEARMRANQEQADHLARLSVLGELSGTLAHELNQPLATIGNYAQSLVRRADNGRLTEDALREAAEEIAGQSERAAGILARVRSFARKRAARHEEHALAAIVQEAVTLFRGMLANAPAVQLIDQLAPGARVRADALQIQQVILNLLKNGDDAMQNMPRAARRMRVVLDRAERDGAAVFTIAVRDFGPGMDEATRAHLFEPFFTTKENGLGLGLSICQRIAEAHGGHLDAARAADADSGMIFTLALPASD